jgi:hypothetical protein
MIKKDGRQWNAITVAEASGREGFVWWRPEGTETGKALANTDAAYVPAEEL